MAFDLPYRALHPAIGGSFHSSTWALISTAVMVLASSCTVSAQPLQPVCEEGDVLASLSSPSPLEEAIASLVLPLRKGTEREMLPVSSFAGAIWFSLPMEICARSEEHTS